ncbi:zinc finger protein SNAI2-like [Centruroides vittatus]|uniref:zinc finger protein SNAI2-like n=1 Tax=Centruroides vittatus TaxID=120091 RepID=UPI00350EAB80
MPRAFLIKKHSSTRIPPKVGAENNVDGVQDSHSEIRGPYDLSVKAKRLESDLNVLGMKTDISLQAKMEAPPPAVALVLPKPSPPSPVKPGAPLEPLNPNTPAGARTSAWHRPVVPPYLPFNFPLYPFSRQDMYGTYFAPTSLVPPPLVPVSPARASPMSPRDGGSPTSIYTGKHSPPMQPSFESGTQDIYHHPAWIADPKDPNLSPAPSTDSESGKEGGIRKRKTEAPRFQCADCNKSYSTNSGLSKHRQFHCVTQNKKSFSCKYCEKVYVSLGALKMHIRTHTLPCKCKLCGKAFSRPWLLQGHIRTHTGEKPFSCPHCSRAFADRSNLRAHLQTHSDVKKYSCKACSKTFSRMSLLLKHSDGCVQQR